MAEITPIALDGTGDIDRLIRDFLAVGSIPDDVLKEMVTRKARVIEEGERGTAKTMLQGPYNKGAVAYSVKSSKARKTKSGAQVLIRCEGEQHGNRLGEIAFINEYGKKSQPARPFIRKAIERWGDAASAEAYKVMRDWMAKNDL